jgi:hypothetical protein
VLEIQSHVMLFRFVSREDRDVSGVAHLVGDDAMAEALSERAGPAENQDVGTVERRPQGRIGSRFDHALGEIL